MHAYTSEESRGAFAKTRRVASRVVQRASEASEADSQSCSIEISDIYIYVCIRTSKYFARASNYVS